MFYNYANHRHAAHPRVITPQRNEYTTPEANTLPAWCIQGSLSWIVAPNRSFQFRPALNDLVFDHNRHGAGRREIARIVDHREP